MKNKKGKKMNHKAPRLVVPAPKVEPCPKKKASKDACRKWGKNE